MKERPIIFSAQMVRAILEGRKTQTRRVIKPQPTVSEQRLRELSAWAEGFTLSQQVNAAFQSGCIDASCPYGRPGDTLWVRETWWGERQDFDAGLRPAYAATDPKTEAGWRSPIHMPRWASRITLEITGVRVERLQDISEADAEAEGVAEIGERLLGVTPCRARFFKLWESINGPGSWDANPWVWVVEFKRAAQAQAKGE